MPTFVLMQVSQVLLVREDDGLVLSDDLAPEALPAGRQLPQLLQFTHSASETQASGPGCTAWNTVPTEASAAREGSHRIRPSRGAEGLPRRKGCTRRRPPTTGQVHREAFYRNLAKCSRQTKWRSGEESGRPGPTHWLLQKPQGEGSSCGHWAWAEQ